MGFSGLRTKCWPQRKSVAGGGEGGGTYLPALWERNTWQMWHVLNVHKCGKNSGLKAFNL